MEDPSHDKVIEDLRRSVSAILPHALHHEKWRNWVLQKLHPVFVENMENSNEETRVWAIKKVGQTASIEPSVKAEAEKKFLEIWFSSDTDPNSDLGKAVREQLIGLASKGLFENVRAKAKNQENKAKAEILLEELRVCLLLK